MSHKPHIYTHTKKMSSLDGKPAERLHIKWRRGVDIGSFSPLLYLNAQMSVCLSSTLVLLARTLSSAPQLRPNKCAECISFLIKHLQRRFMEVFQVVLCLHPRVLAHVFFIFASAELLPPVDQWSRITPLIRRPDAARLGWFLPSWGTFD